MDIARYLLKNRANVDEVYHSESNWSLLMFAAYQGYDKFVKVLLDHGADTTVRSSNGGKGTALEYAKAELAKGRHPTRWVDHEKVVRLLGACALPTA